MTFNATLIICQIRDLLSDSRRNPSVHDFMDGLKCEILIGLMLYETVVWIMQFLGVQTKTDIKTQATTCLCFSFVSRFAFTIRGSLTGLSGIKLFKHSFGKSEKNHTHTRWKNERKKRKIHNLCSYFIYLIWC